MKWTTNTQSLINQSLQELAKMKSALDKYPNNRTLENRVVLVYKLTKELGFFEALYYLLYWNARAQMDQLYKAYINEKTTAHTFQKESLFYQELWAKSKIEVLQLKGEKEAIPALKEYLQFLESIKADINL